jgi:hypothetical protein
VAASSASTAGAPGWPPCAALRDPRPTPSVQPSPRLVFGAQSRKGAKTQPFSPRWASAPLRDLQPRHAPPPGPLPRTTPPFHLCAFAPCILAPCPPYSLRRASSLARKAAKAQRRSPLRPDGRRRLCETFSLATPHHRGLFPAQRLPSTFAPLRLCAPITPPRLTTNAPPPDQRPRIPNPQLFSPPPLASARRISHAPDVRLPAPGGLAPRPLSQHQKHEGALVYHHQSARGCHDEHTSRPHARIMCRAPSS